MAILVVRMNNRVHPPFEYENIEEALQDARNAMATGCYMRDESFTLASGDKDTSSLYIVLGGSSLIWVMSEEARKKQQQEQLAREQMRQGLVAATDKAPGAFKLVIQYENGQLEPPFGFDTREEAEVALADALKQGRIEHAVDTDSYVFASVTAGMVFMIMSDEHYVMQKRKAVEAMMQMAMQHQQQQRAPNKLIIS